VNPVYGKVPVNRKLRSRETQRSILYIYYTNRKNVVRGIRKGPSDLQRGHWYSTVQYGHARDTELVGGPTRISGIVCVENELPVKREMMQSRDAKTVPKSSKIGPSLPN
jgi:hypothetical protein